MNSATPILSQSYSFFEYSYFSKNEVGNEKTLIVSFPGRKSNRLLDSSESSERPFLCETLASSNADVLFIRSVYVGDPTKANINDDFDLLPNLIQKIKEQNNITRVILFGFSLGCAPCLWLARKMIANKVVLIAPGEAMLQTLCYMDDLRWQHDFATFCKNGQSPTIEPFPNNVKMSIFHGLDLEEDRLKEKKLVQYLCMLAPQTTTHPLSGVGHYIPQFWQSQGILKTKIWGALNIQSSGRDYRDQIPVWSKLNTFNHYSPAIQESNHIVING